MKLIGAGMPRTGTLTQKMALEMLESTVPSDRLLVWSVKEGWGPLCELLELPVPEEPFPHINYRTGVLARR